MCTCTDLALLSCNYTWSVSRLSLVLQLVSSSARIQVPSTTMHRHHHQHRRDRGEAPRRASHSESHGERSRSRTRSRGGGGSSDGMEGSSDRRRQLRSPIPGDEVRAGPSQVGNPLVAAAPAPATLPAEQVAKLTSLMNEVSKILQCPVCFDTIIEVMF